MKPKFPDRDHWTFTRFVRNESKLTDPKLTADINDHTDSKVSSNIVQRELPKIRISQNGFNQRIITLESNLWKVFIVVENPIGLVPWAWEYIFFILTDMSLFNLFPTSIRTETAKNIFEPNTFLPTVQRYAGSLMNLLQGAIPWKSVSSKDSL